MEISRLSDNSIKIKTKNSTFVIDPEAKSPEADAYVYTVAQKNIPEGQLAIEGPGEYEIGGVYIKGEVVSDNLVYEFLDETKKVLVLSSPSAIKNLDTEDYPVVIVKASEKVESANLTTIGAELVIVYGPSENISVEPESIKQIDKVNLRKIDELKGFIVYLSK